MKLTTHLNSTKIFLFLVAMLSINRWLFSNAQTFDELIKHGGKAQCDSYPDGTNRYGLTFNRPAMAQPQFFTTHSNEEVAIDSASMMCPDDERTWHLSPRFTAYTSPQEGLRLRLLLTDPRDGVGKLKNMKRFLRQALNQNLRQYLTIINQKDASGKTTAYGFITKPFIKDPIGVMQSAMQRIEKSIKNANSEHVCPLVKGICEFHRFQQQREVEVRHVSNIDASRM